MVASKDTFPLLAELLAEQQRLDTPVARFSIAHENLATGSGAIAPQLIPLTKPGPGEQYAFEVDLDSCTGCKSCVAACHSLNGLDDTETWRDVGLLVSPSRAHPFTQTVTTACHHCADPGCLNGCPVLAYEKDPLTGIVHHLDDQCIGCSYCVLKCPYDVPKYSSRLGIVRKCDMCHGRLAAGEAPACAQACPTHAIKIVTVSTAPEGPESKSRPPTQVSPSALSGFRSPVSGFPSSGFLPAAPDPSITRPTTRYITKRKLPADLIAGDAHTLRPQPPHWPLVALLTLMPMAVGCGLADKLLPLPTPAIAVLGWASGAIGLVFSVLHLGQPLRAWRVFLGLRKSWLSREAVIFGAWLPLATVYTATRLGWLPSAFDTWRPTLAVATVACGMLGLFCSVMIYVDTRRAFWRFSHTAPRFFGSAAVLGLASAFATPGAPLWLGLVLIGATILKLGWEARALAPLAGDPAEISPALRTAQLLSGPLRAINEIRVGCAVLGGILLPLCITFGHAPAWTAWLVLAASLVGELLERSLFFRAVDAPKMPGFPAVATAKASGPS